MGLTSNIITLIIVVIVMFGTLMVGSTMADSYLTQVNNTPSITQEARDTVTTLLTGIKTTFSVVARVGGIIVIVMVAFGFYLSLRGDGFSSHPDVSGEGTAETDLEQRILPPPPHPEQVSSTTETYNKHEPKRTRYNTIFDEDTDIK